MTSRASRRRRSEPPAPASFSPIGLLCFTLLGQALVAIGAATMNRRPRTKRERGESSGAQCWRWLV